MPEYRRGRVRGIEREARRDHAERGEEEEHAHERRHAYRGDGRPVRAAHGLGARHSGIEQPVRAGEGYVAAHRATHERDYRERIEAGGRHRSQRGLGERRVRRDCHVRGERDHHEAHHEREAVHRASRFLHQEDADRYRCADRRAGGHGDAEHHVHPEPRARDVADVEGESAERHERGEEVAEPWEHAVRHILRALAARHDHGPDVELRGEIEDHRREDDERAARPELGGEHRSLCEEPGPDGGRRHQERRAEERGGDAASLRAAGCSHACALYSSSTNFTRSPGVCCAKREMDIARMTAIFG